MVAVIALKLWLVRKPFFFAFRHTLDTVQLSVLNRNHTVVYLSLCFNGFKYKNPGLGLVLLEQTGFTLFSYAFLYCLHFFHSFLHHILTSTTRKDFVACYFFDELYLPRDYIVWLQWLLSNYGWLDNHLYLHFDRPWTRYYVFI